MSLSPQTDRRHTPTEPLVRLLYGLYLHIVVSQNINCFYIVVAKKVGINVMERRTIKGDEYTFFFPNGSTATGVAREYILPKVNAPRIDRRRQRFKCGFSGSQKTSGNARPVVASSVKTSVNITHAHTGAYIAMPQTHRLLIKINHYLCRR